jgi:hypothetical protein
MIFCQSVRTTFYPGKVTIIANKPVNKLFYAFNGSEYTNY